MIRKAEEKDCQSIAEIYNLYLGKGTLHLVNQNRDDYLFLLNSFSMREELWVSTLDDEVIGWSILKLYSPKEGYRYACETSTFFLPEYTGKGYGHKLKKFILDRAVHHDYKYVVARIMSENRGSVGFHAMLGYRIVGEQYGIGDVNGKMKNVTVMEKIL